MENVVSTFSGPGGKTCGVCGKCFFWAGGGWKVRAHHNSKNIHGIEMKFGTVVENYKLINLVSLSFSLSVSTSLSFSLFLRLSVCLSVCLCLFASACLSLSLSFAGCSILSCFAGLVCFVFW